MIWNIEKWINENKLIQAFIKIANYFPVFVLIILVLWSYFAFVIRLCILYLIPKNIAQGKFIVFIIFDKGKLID